MHDPTKVDSDTFKEFFREVIASMNFIECLLLTLGNAALCLSFPKLLSLLFQQLGKLRNRMFTTGSWQYCLLPQLPQTNITTLSTTR